MKITFVKILAIGCNKRFLWLRVNDVGYCIRISDKMYGHLRELGVPTSQSLRKKK